MALRKSLEALGIWLSLAPWTSPGSPGSNPPGVLGKVPTPACLPRHRVCRWLGKCQLWSKYHRAQSSWGPSLGLALGTHTPHLSPACQAPPEVRTSTHRQQRPGPHPSPLSAYTDVFYFHTSTPFPFRGGGGAVKELPCNCPQSTVSAAGDPEDPPRIRASAGIWGTESDSPWSTGLPHLPAGRVLHPAAPPGAADEQLGRYRASHSPGQLCHL